MAGVADKKLVIVSNVLTPYRVHLHKRIAAEIPGIELHTILTHASADFTWKLRIPDEIHVRSFAEGTERAEEAIWRRPISEYRKGGQVIKFLVELQPDAVILNGYADTGRLRILKHLHREGVPAFIRGDSNVLGDKSTGIKRALKKRILSWVIGRATGIMAMGQLGLEYFERYGADSRRCYIMPYEPDLALVSDDRARNSEGWKIAGIPQNHRLIVFAGRLVPVKRVDLLLSAFSSIAQIRPDWRLVIAGDGPLRDSLEASAPAALADRIHWLGFLEANEAASLFATADILVQPSDFEPWGVAIEEALAAGMVVVASNVVGAAREMLPTDQDEGFVFQAGDGSDLEKKLRYATDPAQHEMMKEIGHGYYCSWKAEHDPVIGLMTALSDVGILRSH